MKEGEEKRETSKLKADAEAKAQLAELEAKLTNEKTETEAKLAKEAAELQGTHGVHMQQSKDANEERRRAI